jgi:ketosteroid isomerase-like protein
LSVDQPKHLIDRWVGLFNAKDVEGLAAMYTEDWGILEWKDPKGLRGCGFFQFRDGKIAFQRGYWDKLTFLRQHGLPIPAQ